MLSYGIKILEMHDFYKALDIIDEGLITQHKVYGEGVITDVFENKYKRSIRVDFGGTARLLDLKVCLGKGIINF